MGTTPIDIMPVARLSGTVLGSDDPARPVRAKLLFLLFNAGWDISNANGRQTITLSNIEKKITESDAFVFTPQASLEDMFKAISVFVGYQTLDKYLSGKPTVILNGFATTCVKLVGDRRYHPGHETGSRRERSWK